MEVVFYNNASSNNTVPKVLTEIKTFDVDLKASCNVEDPVLLLAGKYLNANYARIDDFGRCYFVDPPSQIRKNLWQYNLHSDGLVSFKEQIKANKAILARTSQDEFANLYLPDDRRMVTSETFTRYKFFPNGIFSGFENIENPGIFNYLVCIAGVQPDET